jgi:hypothetical protein
MRNNAVNSQNKLEYGIVRIRKGIVVSCWSCLFACGLFNDDVSSSECIGLGDAAVNE